MRRPRRRHGGWPTPRAGTLDLTCPAPTALPGHPFTLTLTGAWEELPSPRPHHSPHAAAADHALEIARTITADYLATDAVPATARINTVLGCPTDLPTLPIRLLWGHVHLTAEPGAVQAAHNHQQHLHDLQQRHAEHTRRLDHAHTLRDTLMSDPSLALSYWFATAPQTIDTNTLTRLENLFTQAAAYAPHGQWAPLARLLHAFAEGLTDDAKNHLIDTLATLTDRYGRPDITAAIQTARIPPTTHSTQPSAPDRTPKQQTAPMTGDSACRV
ncbi:hypothetical protein ACIRVK_35005 [Streptomyces sp. NPDC101152]|uniref:hypothetical protein n=1 Tax=Streptomyces sp. NPDC101152 TaxID=3366116 RepID=UPI0037F95681